MFLSLGTSKFTPNLNMLAYFYFSLSLAVTNSVAIMKNASTIPKGTPKKKDE